MATKSNLYSWVNSEFAKMMGSKVDSALIHYFLTISSEEDMREYLADLFPILQPTIFQTFIDQLQSKKSHVTHEHIPTFQSENSDALPPPKPTNTLTLPLIPCPPKNSKKGNTVVPHELPTDAPKPYMKPSQNELVYMPERKHMRDNTSHSGSECVEDSLTKKRLGHRFVPFTSSEGARISTKLPGRHICQCIGQKHALINNCTECGRVVCSQEGAGPCLFCGALVVSPQDQETLRKGGKKAAAILDSINKKFSVQSSDDPLCQKSDSSSPASLKTAEAYRDRLLEYDRTCQQRTKVFDDESDYYRATKWMSPEEAARAEQVEETQHKLKHPSKRGAVTVTLDFSGRQVFEDEKPQLSERDARAFIEGDVSHQQSQSADRNVKLDAESLAHPNIPFAPKFLLQHSQQHNPPYSDLSGDNLSNYRIQDSHLAELCDSGSCLSMHQPWASLLVHGIKRIEGRTWYTTHRGRLWIASTAKIPSEEDIADVETFYQGILGDVEFPNSYPSSTLLGCVHLKDCLVREDYLSLPFKDETESPYGFICEDPHFLKIKVPIKGMHKIWKLDKSTHKMCNKFLSPSNPTF